jgi:hypothetical protein
MDKFALLVGVSQCAAAELPTLRRARTNGEVLKRSLQATNAGFEVQTLYDVPQLDMATTIEQFFRHRDGDDQIFFLFSGYVFKDVDEELYLATPTTTIDDWGQLVRAKTIPMRFLVNIMDASPAWRQVIIFDACFRLTQGIDPDEPEILMEEWFNEMMGDRRVILTASTYTQHEPEPESLDAWSYTRYIAEGAATGAADTDLDGSLTVKELHFYAQRKLRIAAPSQRPQFYGSEATANQMLLQVPCNTPAVQYRQFLEKLTETSEIDLNEFRILTGRNRLNAFRQHLGISQSEAAEIEFEVLRPFQEHQQRKQLFQEYLAQLTEEGYES